MPAYDLAGSGCAGFVLGLDVACARARWRGERVLLIGVEVLSRMMDWQDRNVCVLFGDGAGAALLGPLDGRGGAEVLAVVAGTEGARADILGLEVGGSRRPVTAEHVRDRRHLKIEMKGREVFKEAVGRMSEASRAVLARAGLDLEDVALVVPHQANLRIIRAVAKALGVPLGRVAVNVDRYGNTGSASIPLALAQARDEGRIQPGDAVLLTSFGAGFHWAAALLRF
ncbi:MAG: hypothetical protein D6692_07215 [Planctomycetota bacterium]|nr:MAG: hypothetical protein D6692_07215 [Planctomycetota bacterium]